MIYADYAIIYKALGDETRTKIFDMLKNGTMCACKILDAFNCTQPTLSYHMKMLCDSRLVIGEKDGKWMHYTINKEMLGEVAAFLTSSSTREVNNCCDS